MKKLIVGNWKLHPATLKEAKQLFEAVKNTPKGDSAEVVVCPPFMYLSEIAAMGGMKLGAQNTTAEFPAGRLKEMGLEYIILGHSDVRKLGETNEQIKQKIQESLTTGLKVILCVGEKKGENKEEVLRQQLAGVSGVIIAYEPVWAISNGDPYQTKELPSAQIVKESLVLIKEIVGDEKVKILYGGSTNAANAADYLKNAGVDGLLVGGASLKPEEFTAIAKSAQ